MQHVHFKAEYDAIIIGAGVAGLTTAALLSKAGLSVCVLEMGANAGGYLAGFRRKDFRFDTAIHWLNQCGPDGMVTRVFDLIGNDYPHARPQKHIRRYKGEHHDYLLTNNPDELLQQWIREFPGDEPGLRRFFAAAERLGRSFKYFNGYLRSEETMTFWERLRNKRRLLQFALPFIPWIRFSGPDKLKKGLRKFFKSEKLHDVFAADMELLSCLVPIGWAYYGDYQSPPAGGGQVIPEWLSHVTESFGNDIFFKCKVKQVLEENGTCTGVLLDHRGTEHRVRGRYVVAACDAETLYRHMLPGAEDGMCEKLRDAELYSSSVTVSIALDCCPSKLGFGEELVHLASEHVPKGMHAAGDPETTEISILAPSLRDPSLAPEGCGTLTLFMPALMDYEGKWRTETDAEGNPIRGEAYKMLKTDIAGVLIRRVQECIAPGLRDHILFFDVATPVTHWRYTGNKGGSMMGTKPGRKNMQSKVARYRTPLKNLFLSGHWAELGGGVPIAVKSAANAALLVLQQQDPALFRILAGYMDNNIPLQQVLSSDLWRPYANDWIPEPTPAQKRSARQEKES